MPLKTGVIKDGEIREKDYLAQAIKEVLAKTKGERIKTKHVVASLPEEKSFLQVIQMPKLAKEELKSSVYFEAENYIPLPIEDTYLDFQIIKPVQDHLDHHDVLICALPKEVVDSYLTVIKKAGLQPIALEVESQAVIRALVKDEVSFTPILVVDFGKSNTSFIIFCGYSIRFTSSIPLSSQGLTEAISENLKIDFEQAEKIKLEYDFKKIKKDQQTEKIFKAIEPILNELIGQIRKYLDFYQTHSSHEHLLSEVGQIKKILLCGGGANLKGFDNFLAEELNIPVEIGNPWVNISPESVKKSPIFPDNTALAYTTALGLALRAAKEKQ